MKQKLTKLFDYQKFEQNKELQKVIEESLRYETKAALSDDALGLVAGGRNNSINNKKEEEKKEDI